MITKRPLFFVGIGLCMVISMAFITREPEVEKKPNVIFILTDDHRWDALGYAGNTIIQTPELDKLAKTGVYFKNAFVTTPICAASRASILSSMQERTHKYTFQTGDIRHEYMQESYPALVKAAGYFTGFFGKFGVKYANSAQLFHVFEDYDRGPLPEKDGYFYKKLGNETVHLTRYTGQKALDFIDKTPNDKPFCLSLSFSAPHAHDNSKEQYYWQKESDKLYENVVIPEPKLADDDYFNRLPKGVREGFSRTRWAWRFDTPEKYQKSVKGYYRMITEIDSEIAKIRKKLAEKGLDKNTVIIVMGDNGYFLGDRQLADKWMMYDMSIRVPLIVYDPRVKQHKDINEMALNIDVPATIIDFLGIKQPQSWHGKSLRPMVTGEKKTLNRDTLLIEHLWEFDKIPPSEGIRTAQWKYFRYVNDKTTEELYNLKNDPLEVNNLAQNKDYQQVLKNLRTQCEQLIKKYADPYSGVPSGLMVEFIREPKELKINDPLPEFSWIVPHEAVNQSAYQLLVSSSKELIDNNIGDVWNSGQVRSAASTNITCGGKPLSPHTNYFWKVRVWDKDNRLSDYSSPQQFTTGDFRGTVSSKNSIVEELIAPKVFTKTKEGSYFIDFGKDAFGKLSLTYQTDRSDTIVIRLGEKLLNGKIDRNPSGTIRFAEYKLAVSPAQTNYVVELPADKRNTSGAAVILPPSMGVVLPFRYCELDNVRQAFAASQIKQKAYFHYFDDSQSSFTSSDTTLNQIWDLCKYSMKATSFMGLYIDGDRERIPYEGDAYINQLGHYNTDREYSMAKQTIEYFMKNSTWPTEWLLHNPMIVYQDYLYSGDTELIKAYYENLKLKSLSELTREDGLISTKTNKVNVAFMKRIGFTDTTKLVADLVDWPPAQKDTGWKLATAEGERDGHEMLPINTVVNSFFYMDMKIMAKFAEILNKPADKDYYELMAAKVKQAMNEKLFNTEKGIYIDGENATHSSLHSNMLPLAFGIVPATYKKSVAAFVKSRGMACSVYGAQFLLEGLYQAQEGQYALDLMRATHDRSWWNMIKTGSTITLEAWDMKYKPNSDWNHAWGAVPANIIPRYLWGIQPQSAGFQKASIKPQMGNLKSTSIVVPTLQGQIKGSYVRVNAQLQRYSIELPANMVGDFEIDNYSDGEVSLNGQRVNPSFGSIRLNPGMNKIEIRINSF